MYPNIFSEVVNESALPVHAYGQPFECSYCEKTFMSKKLRDRHEKSGHLSKDPNVSFKYNCDKCDYKTDDKDRVHKPC